MADYAAKDKLAKQKKNRLKQIKNLINFSKIDKILRKKYKYTRNASGHPAYSPLLLFKIVFLQNLYNLSDYEIEECLNDRLSFMEFVGLSMEDEVPDHSTICRFRQRLLKLNLHEELFKEINEQLRSQGIILEKGVILDATVIRANSACKKRKEEKEVERGEIDTLLKDNNGRGDREIKEEVKVNDKGKDNLREKRELNEVNIDRDTESKGGERRIVNELKSAGKEDSKIKEGVREGNEEGANWLKKGKEIIFGYKAHVAVDSREGFILSVLLTGANIHESNVLKELVNNLKSKGLEISKLYADKGYSSKSNRNYLRENNIEDFIMHKKPKGKELSEIQKKLNELCSKVRYKIERSFGTLKSRYGLYRFRYKGINNVLYEFIMKSTCFNVVKALRMSF
jgi:IS5 family transposase